MPICPRFDENNNEGAKDIEMNAGCPIRGSRKCREWIREWGYDPGYGCPENVCWECAYSGPLYEYSESKKGECGECDEGANGVPGYDDDDGNNDDRAENASGDSDNGAGGASGNDYYDPRIGVINCVIDSDECMEWLEYIGRAAFGSIDNKTCRRCWREGPMSRYR